jgi:hypothetical protein
MPGTGRITFNGIHEDTGTYLIPPLTPAELAMAAFGRPEEKDEDHQADLVFKKNRAGGDLGVKSGVKADDLSSAGWGVIFARDTPEEFIEALAPLLEQRQKDAGKLYRCFKDADAYQHKDGRGESKPGFLLKRKAPASGDVDPAKMPYYLLLVGAPDQIPLTFQYQLDVPYSVGRIHFDKAEDYWNYAQSVVAAENGKLNVPNRAVFFGPANPNDDSTARSSQHLVSPLAQLMSRRKDASLSWSIEKLSPEQSTRARLGRLLGGGDTPGFLFTASHGMGGYRPDDPRIFTRTGALTCQDWGGPGSGGNVRETYFAAEDLSSDARLAGLIAMVFACYGGGCPEFNNFFLQDGLSKADRIAPRPFLSALPKRMLCHPKGGALAVIAHADRVWDCSFLNEDQQRELATFEGMLGELLDGKPVGLALERFNQRYAEISSDLTAEMESAQLFGEPPDKELFAGLWTTVNDARNYMILGDPAVRLRIGEPLPDPRQADIPAFPAA